MLTPLRTSFRSSLLSLVLVAASFAAFPAPAHAGPCEVEGTLGCGAEGQAPGNPGGPGGPGGGNGGGGGNNGPGTGPDDNEGGAPLPGNIPAPAPALPNTQDTIAMAFNQIEFPVPTINSAPEEKTYVRVKTSFWIPADELEEITVQASVGAAEGVQPQTITATAELKYVHWDLDEDEMTCEGPGRPYGEGPGEECDHYFKTSSVYHGKEKFEIKATPYWYITWTCAGVCPEGTAGIVEDEYGSPAGVLELLVDEIQTEAKD